MNIRVRHTFIFTTDEENAGNNDESLFRLQEFLNQCGVEAEEGESVMEQLARIEGLQFLGLLRIEPDKKDPDVQRVRIGRTLSLEDVEDYA